MAFAGAEEGDLLGGVTLLYLWYLEEGLYTFSSWHMMVHI